MSELSYTESKRDLVESRPVKREIDGREDSFIKVSILWQKLGNVCTLFLWNKKENTAAEFVIPNDEISHWLAHPYSHPDANLIPRSDQLELPYE
jgi:hypothetical protein